MGLIMRDAEARITQNTHTPLACQARWPRLSGSWREGCGIANIWFFLGSRRSTVGKCTGPKWSKMVRTTILVKMTLFRTGFWYSRDQNRPKWSILVYFALERSILVHLGPPTVLWLLLTFVREVVARFEPGQLPPNHPGT